MRFTYIKKIVFFILVSSYNYVQIKAMRVMHKCYEAALMVAEKNLPKILHCNFCYIN